MKFICLFGQRKERYLGQYAPELLAAIDEIGNDDNPLYLDTEEEKCEESGDFSILKRMTFSVNDKEFNREFYPSSKELTATVEKEAAP